MSKNKQWRPYSKSLREFWHLGIVRQSNVGDEPKHPTSFDIDHSPVLIVYLALGGAAPTAAADNPCGGITMGGLQSGGTSDPTHYCQPPAKSVTCAILQLNLRKTDQLPLAQQSPVTSLRIPRSLGSEAYTFRRNKPTELSTPAKDGMMAELGVNPSWRIPT